MAELKKGIGYICFKRWQEKIEHRDIVTVLLL
jgi:hypothetical protein